MCFWTNFGLYGQPLNVGKQGWSQRAHIKRNPLLIRLMSFDGWIRNLGVLDSKRSEKFVGPTTMRVCSPLQYVHAISARENTPICTHVDLKEPNSFQTFWMKKKPNYRTENLEQTTIFSILAKTKILFTTFLRGIMSLISNSWGQIPKNLLNKLSIAFNQRAEMYLNDY